jgi:hypothetical protein
MLRMVGVGAVRRRAMRKKAVARVVECCIILCLELVQCWRCMGLF